MIYQSRSKRSNNRVTYAAACSSGEALRYHRLCFALVRSIPPNNSESSSWLRTTLPCASPDCGQVKRPFSNLLAQTQSPLPSQPARQHNGQPATRFLLRRRFLGRQLHLHQLAPCRNSRTPSLPTPLSQMAIQRAQTQTPTLAKFAPPHTAIYKLSLCTTVEERRFSAAYSCSHTRALAPGVHFLFSVTYVLTFWRRLNEKPAAQLNSSIPLSSFLYRQQQTQTFTIARQLNSNK